MADESLLDPPPQPPPATKLRTHAALIQCTVPLVSDTGEPAGEVMFEVDVRDPRLGTTARNALIDTVRRIAQFVGRIS